MNCKMFRLQLDGAEWSRDGLKLLPDLQAHLEICAACRTHFLLQQRLVAALENDAAPMVPADFAEKILRHLGPAVAPARAKLLVSWKRMAIYAGYALALGFALWVGFRNFDLNAMAQWQNSVWALQLQHWLVAIGASDVWLALKSYFANLLSLIPTTAGLIEKFFGEEALPTALNLTMIVTLTYLVAKVSVFIESRLRHGAQRNS